MTHLFIAVMDDRSWADVLRWQKTPNLQSLVVPDFPGTIGHVEQMFNVTAEHVNGMTEKPSPRPVDLGRSRWRSACLDALKDGGRTTAQIAKAIGKTGPRANPQTSSILSMMGSLKMIEQTGELWHLPKTTAGETTAGEKAHKDQGYSSRQHQVLDILLNGPKTIAEIATDAECTKGEASKAVSNMGNRNEHHWVKRNTAGKYEITTNGRARLTELNRKHET